MGVAFATGTHRVRGILLALCAACLWQGPAQAGTTLADVRNRGELRCGVADGVPGIARQEEDGRWSGIEPDFCRAVAAAVLGEAGRVRFVPLAASARFPALLTRRIDLLLANTSWTMSREVALGVRFPATLLFDGQSFMVPAANPAQDPRELRGARVCVEKDTTHAQRLRDLATRGGFAVESLPAPSATAAADAFFAGQCAALTAEATQLAALRQRAGVPAAAYRILPRAISREALGPVVRGDDREWEIVVRWVFYALVMAEELDIDGRAAADARLPAWSEFWGTTDDESVRVIGQALGLEPGALLRGVSAAGNYGELFDRNLGKGSPLGLERGANRLWKDGGLMHAPPIR